MREGGRRGQRISGGSGLVGLRTAKWISGLAAAALGAALVVLCVQLRDDFPARWASIEPGTPASQVVDTLGEPSNRVPAETTLPLIDTLVSTKEIWVFDRPIGLGHSYNRYVLLLVDNIVIQKEPNDEAPKDRARGD